MRKTKVEPEHIDALIQVGLIEQKGQAKKKALFITPKGKRLQEAIMKEYKINLFNDRGWIDARGNIMQDKI